MDKKERPDYRLLLLGWMVVVLMLFAIFASGEECGKAYYAQFKGRSKQAINWMILNDQSYLEIYKGYVISVRSESPYLPCRMSQTMMVWKENSLVITKNGELVFGKEWLGGYIVQIQMALLNGKVVIFTKEYLHECWRDNPTLDLKKMLSCAITYHRWREP